MDIFREIKYAYQRVVRGYDERILWEFDGYFNQFIPPLKEFCIEEIKECEYDTKRKEVFTTTLRLIKDFEDMTILDWYKNDNPQAKLWEYFGKNIGYYWN